MSESAPHIPAVTVENLTKVFKAGLGKKAFTAVRDVSLQVKSGEVYGLIGPNGSGKSTTMKAILGLLAPTLGKTTIFGRSSTDVTSRQEVGFLPENPYFYKHLSGMETLLFYGRLCSMERKDLKDRAREMLALTGLEDAADRRVAGFSKGMLQRLGLAQALLHRPRLIVLDEPTAGVDPAGSRKMRDLVLGFKKQGLTVLVTSHLLEQMQEVCDRVGIMANGRMMREGRVEDLVAVGNQTELVLSDASPDLLEQINRLIEKHGTAKLIHQGHPKTTLERLFLEVTAEGNTQK